jgi:hypothetical protein
LILSNSRRLTVALLALLLSLCCVATAQQDDRAVAPKREAATATQPTIEEAKPSIYYLPDKQGNLQPVLDFPYQDFLDLYKLKNQLRQRNEPPRYSIQRMTAIGAAGAENVELQIRFHVSVLNDDWVRIPLRLEQGVLRGAAQYKGQGEHLIHYEAEGEGYVCWVRGAANSEHEIALTLLVPLAGKGDQPRLKLFLPRTTASELQLTVPMADAIGTVSDGATAISSTALHGNATALNVVGLGGEFELSWRKTDPRVVEMPPALEVIGAMFSRLDGRLVAADATLSVRSYGAAFDRFIVQLPPGMEWTPKTGTTYDVVPLETNPSDKTLPHRVEVRLPKKSTGPIDVRLSCRRPYDPTKDRHGCELAGFAVVDAIRQWGTHTVAAPDDWQVSWDAPTTDRLKETKLPPESLRKEEDVVANFEYSAQPYALTAKLSPRKTQIHVEPKYQLSIDPDKVRLEGTLIYTIRGSKISTLEVAMPGWTLDEVGPENLISPDGATDSNDHEIFTLAKPTSGTFELLLRAHRDIDVSADSLRIELPKPKSDYAAPTSLSVAPADNVELVADSQNIKGLARRWKDVPKSLDVFAEPQRPTWQYQGTGGQAIFAAKFRIHPGDISVDTSTQVNIRERKAEVEQRQAYTIAYEPVDQLTLAIPRILTKAKRLEVFCDGKPLTLASVSADPTSVGPVPMRAILPRPRIGTCELMLRYSMPLDEPTPEQPSSVSLPLPMPTTGRRTSNTILLKTADNLRAVPNLRDDWNLTDADTTAGDGREIRLTADKAVGRLDMKLRWNDDAVGNTVVSRAWVQTWFSTTLRQDRAAYQVITDRQELQIQFPPETALDQAVVFVDGKQVNGQSIGKNRLLIPLPTSRERRRVVLELLYHEADQRSPRGAIQVAFPRIGPGAWVRRLYWQLVLPSDEHVVSHPDTFTGEFVWSGRNYFLEKQPILNQEQLERWIGVASRAPLPERANQYLYSTLGDPQKTNIRTAGRTWIVLLASGAALVAGLLLIYMPVCRKPAVLLSIGIVLAAAGLIAPELTLLLTQASALGFVLSLMAGLLERGVTRQHRRAAIHKEPSHVRVELGSTYVRSRTPSSSAPASTETLPTIQPSPPENANP